jgi:entericidin B
MICNKRFGDAFVLLGMEKKLLNREVIMSIVMKSFLLGLVLAAGLAGCNTIEGAGEDLEQAGEAINEEAEEE